MGGWTGALARDHLELNMPRRSGDLGFGDCVELFGVGEMPGVRLGPGVGIGCVLFGVGETPGVSVGPGVRVGRVLVGGWYDPGRTVGPGVGVGSRPGPGPGPLSPGGNTRSHCTFGGMGVGAAPSGHNHAGLSGLPHWATVHGL